MTDPTTRPDLPIPFERDARIPIKQQVYEGLRQAILDGVLEPGHRLPSERDLAVQLGVARGTVRAVYHRLLDEDLVFGAGSAGTRVRSEVPTPRPSPEPAPDRPIASAPFSRRYAGRPLPFEMGVPAQDAFPAKVWARMRASALRSDAHAYTSYPDPRGEPELRAQIASQLAIRRQVRCHPDQIVVTGGYGHGLSLTLAALRAHGREAWIEDPGYPIGRRALELAEMRVHSIPVDADGLRVDAGIDRAPDALLAVVTPGQHAPLGYAMSLRRRRSLLDWAVSNDRWIVEDDYLSELQLDRRAAPALASGDDAGRVVHLGSFSKTLTPALGLGFLVAPPALADRFAELAAVLMPAPNRTTQLAVAEFIAEGHYLRHLRQMKTLYVERRKLALKSLGDLRVEVGMSGLALIAHLPEGFDDVGLAKAARGLGIAPVPLSIFYAQPETARRGLLLSVTNVRADNARSAGDTLAGLLSSGNFQAPSARIDLVAAETVVDGVSLSADPDIEA